MPHACNRPKVETVCSNHRCHISLVGDTGFRHRFIHHFLSSSEEMLCFITTLAIGHLPPLDVYCVSIIPTLRMRMMAIVKNRLSYFAASTRNTNSTQIGNTRIAVLPAISCWKVSSVHSNPLERHALGQGLGEDAGDRLLRPAARIAGRRTGSRPVCTNARHLGWWCA
jgi:hypothetical protein